MTMRLLGDIAAIAACLALGSCDTPTPTDPGNRLYASLAQQNRSVDAAGASVLLNDYRRSLGLAPVVVDPALQRFAEAQLDKVAGSSSLKIPGGLSVKQRLAAAGIQADTASENVSAGYYSMSDAFSGWRGSQPNDATLRLAGAKRMGIATRYMPGSKYAVYWVLVMAGG